MTTSPSTSRSRSGSASVGVSRKPRAVDGSSGCDASMCPAPASMHQPGLGGLGQRLAPGALDRVVVRRRSASSPYRIALAATTPSSVPAISIVGALDRDREQHVRRVAEHLRGHRVRAVRDDRADLREPARPRRLEHDGAAGGVAEQRRPCRGRAGRRAGRTRSAPATASSTGAEGRGGRPLAVVVRAGGDDVDARRQAVLTREQLADPVVADDDEAGLDQPKASQR